MLRMAACVGFEAQGAPVTTSGKMAAIVFGVVGILLFGCMYFLGGQVLVEFMEQLCKPLIGAPRSDPAQERSRLYQLMFLLILIFWIGGAAFFSWLENWEMSSALYICYMWFTTIGFSKDGPSTFLGHALCVLYIYGLVTLSVGVYRRFSELEVREKSERAPLIARSDSWQDHAWPPLAGLAGVVALALLGAFVFPDFEREAELESYMRSRLIFEDLNNLATFEGCKSEFFKNMDVCKNKDMFRERIRPFFAEDTHNSMVDRKLWTPLGAGSYVVAVASAVGYTAGRPRTANGKLATVVFGLFAIPCFVRYAVGFASMVAWAVNRPMRAIESLSFRASGTTETMDGHKDSKESMTTCGVVVFLIWAGGGVVFTCLEEWTFFESLYFCFVTLSRVGFSNMLPKKDITRFFAVLYLVVGLGSVAALISALLARLEEWLAHSASLRAKDAGVQADTAA